jgi:hypothetical protein
MKRLFETITSALVISFCASSAQSQSSTAITLSQEPWTVLTMAPDGSWGAATDLFINRAIADAIRMCRHMSGKQLGCGAVLTSVQAGWSLGVRCGEENIVVADHNLVEAERMARQRELEFRFRHEIDLPPCGRVVTVDPQGRILTPQPEAQLAGQDRTRNRP